MGCFHENLSPLSFHPVSRSFWEAIDPPAMFTSSIASGLTNASITQYMVVSATLFNIRGEKKTEKPMILLQLELTQSSEEVHTPVFNETSPPLFAASGYLITQVANDTGNKAETGTCSDTIFGETKESAAAHRHDPETWRSIHKPVKMSEATHDSEWLMQSKKRKTDRKSGSPSKKDRSAPHGSMANDVHSAAGVLLHMNIFSTSQGANEKHTSKLGSKRILLADYQFSKPTKNKR